MADSFITDLPILITPANFDVLPIVDLANNTTKQIAVSSLRNSFTGNIASVSANWSSVYTNVNSNSANYVLDGGNTKNSALNIGSNNAFNTNFRTAGITSLIHDISGNLILNPNFSPNSANVGFGNLVIGDNKSVSAVGGNRLTLRDSSKGNRITFTIGSNVVDFGSSITIDGVYFSNTGSTDAIIFYTPRFYFANGANQGEVKIFTTAGLTGSLSLGNNNKIASDGDNILALRNGVLPQTLNIYGSLSSNAFERLTLKNSAGNNSIIGAEASGIGVWRNIEFQTLTATRMTVKTNGAINFTPLAADPVANNSAGDVYYNSILNALEVFNGVNYVPLQSTRTIATFTPLQNQPVSANFATLNTRNSDNLAVLQFSQGSPIKEARFVGVIPDNANLVTGTLLVRTEFCTVTASTGVCRWGAQIKKLSTLSYAASGGVNVTVSGTPNRTTMIGAITLPAIDSLVAGDAFDLRIFRESNNVADTMTGDSAQLLTVEVRTTN